MKKKITIGVIGFGRFGTLTSAVFSKDFVVKVHHYKKLEENVRKADQLGVELVGFEELALCDVVILSVPISKTEEVIKRVAPLMRKDSILIDTCSVKTLPCKWLEQNTPESVSILGTHPMFGPVTTKFDLENRTWDLEDKQIVLCPLRIDEERLNRVKKYLVELGLDVIITTPEDHDRQNAKTLGLVHFLGRSLSRAKIGEQRIYTPGYTDVLKILPHTNQDDWQLFFDMHNFNPYSKEVRDNFMRACEHIEEKIIKSDSEDDFASKRKMIDKIDNKIFSLLEKRLKCVEQIGKIKKENGMNVVDPKREKEIIKKHQESTSLSKSFIDKYYKLIFSESYKKQ